MADLTEEIELSEDWLNVSTLLTEGTTYSGDLRGVEIGAIVYQAITDDGTPPSDIITGHPWQPTYAGSASPNRRLTVSADTVLWLRVSRGIAFLVVSPV